MITPTPLGRDVRIVDAKYFDGPDSLAAILGFLGEDVRGFPAAPGDGSPAPRRPDRVDDLAR